MPASDEKIVAVVEGDGISPEIMREAVKILDIIQQCTPFKVKLVDAPAGGEVYKKVGSPIPEKSLKTMEGADAILFGAVGLPNLPPGIAEMAILTIRQHFDQYVNLRPIKLFDSVRDMCPLKDEYIGTGIDMVIVRENTESLYAKIGGILRTDEVATNLMVYTKKGVDRIIKHAFGIAEKEGRKRKLTSVDKANILAVSQLWRTRFHEIAKEHPDVAVEDVYVDAFCQWLIRKPSAYDVVVTENMFGDIVSDEAAYLLGSLGMAPSGNINPEGISMFEPIHGSAPDIAGKNIANPVGMILATKIMLSEAFKENDIAADIETAVDQALREARTADIKKNGLPTFTTVEMGDFIGKKLKAILKK